MSLLPIPWANIDRGPSGHRSEPGRTPSLPSRDWPSRGVDKSKQSECKLHSGSFVVEKAVRKPCVYNGPAGGSHKVNHSSGHHKDTLSFYFGDRRHHKNSLESPCGNLELSHGSCFMTSVIT